MHCNNRDPKIIAEFAEYYRNRGGMRHSAGSAYAQNEFVFELSKKYSDVIIPYAHVKLWNTPALAQIRKYADAGYKALKFIYPEFKYDHDSYMPIYEATEECGLPCLFHTGLFRANPENDTCWKRPVLRNMHPITLTRIVRSFPKLHLTTAHLRTSMFLKEGGKLVNRHPNFYGDLADSGNFASVMPDELERLLNSVWYVREVDCYSNLIFGPDS